MALWLSGHKDLRMKNSDIKNVITQNEESVNGYTVEEASARCCQFCGQLPRLKNKNKCH